MKRIVLAGALDADAEARLAARCELVRADPRDPAGLLHAVASSDGLIVRTNVPVTRELLAAGGRLRVVGVAGVGTDLVDLDAAAERGVTVLNRAAAASDAVAELTLALMLALVRPTAELCRRYAAGDFHAARAAASGRELCDLTVGILGMGRIGSRVGRICAAGIGARVRYTDIRDVGPFDFPCTRVELDTLLASADVLTLHVPLTPLTRGMIGAQALARLRPGALLINTARGAVVDTAALVEALGRGALGGCALDVTEPEPLPPGHPLFGYQNCVLTPHVASRTLRGLRGMFGIVDDVIEFLERGGAPPS